MRRKAGHLSHAHYELESWASWKHTHQGENGVLGAQVMSWDGIVSDMPSKSLVPKLDMPRSISLVDIAYNGAPESHKLTIRIKYLDMGKVSRHAEDRMLEYISGILAGGRYEASREKEVRKSAAKRDCQAKKVYRI